MVAGGTRAWWQAVLEHGGRWQAALGGTRAWWQAYGIVQGATVLYDSVQGAALYCMIQKVYCTVL